MELIEIETGEGQRLLVIWTVRDPFATRVENRHPTPKIEPILIADTVAVSHETGKQIGVRL